MICTIGREKERKMINKVDYYLGVFLIMLAAVAEDNIGPFAGAEIVGEQPVLGFLSLVAWWGCILCLVIKAFNLFVKNNRP